MPYNNIKKPHPASSLRCSLETSCLVSSCVPLLLSASQTNLFSLSLRASLVSSLFFYFPKQIQVFIAEKSASLSLFLILSQWDLCGEAPQWNNILTHESGHVRGRSADRGNFLCGLILFYFLTLDFVLVQGWLDDRVQLRKQSFPQDLCSGKTFLA